MADTSINQTLPNGLDDSESEADQSKDADVSVDSDENGGVKAADMSCMADFSVLDDSCTSEESEGKENESVDDGNDSGKRKMLLKN